MLTIILYSFRIQNASVLKYFYQKLFEVNYMFDFGLRIRQLRESRNMSQEELGRRVGRSKPVISNYENNIKFPPLEVLISIANVFNVSLDYLVGIEKKDALYINNLNETQSNIMKLLYEEFSDCNLKGKELSNRQQKILSMLLVEFLNS